MKLILIFNFVPIPFSAALKTGRPASSPQEASSMLVCHCKGLTDRQVRDAVRDGAGTRRQLSRSCGAGAVCGGCRPVLEEILDEESPARASSGFFGLELAAS
jgi:bacterioferritin-associated ferredoxin